MCKKLLTQSIVLCFLLFVYIVLCFLLFVYMSLPGSNIPTGGVQRDRTGHNRKNGFRILSIIHFVIDSSQFIHLYINVICFLFMHVVLSFIHGLDQLLVMYPLTNARKYCVTNVERMFGPFRKEIKCAQLFRDGNLCWRCGWPCARLVERSCVLSILSKSTNLRKSNNCSNNEPNNTSLDGRHTDAFQHFF